MYGTFTYMHHKNQPNVGEYTIHGWYGVGIPLVGDWRPGEVRSKHIVIYLGGVSGQFCLQPNDLPCVIYVHYQG